MSKTLETSLEASNATRQAVKGHHHSRLNYGSLKQLGQYDFNAPQLPFTVNGKAFLKQDLGLSSMEISLSQLAPGGAIPFWHRHTENEEVYLFLAGHGQMMVDDDCFEVTEGTAVAIRPAGQRTLRNLSETEPLVFTVIQARQNSLPTATIEDGQPVDRPIHWP